MSIDPSVLREVVVVVVVVVAVVGRGRRIGRGMGMRGEDWAMAVA